MKRLVLGTASLGSRVVARESAAVIRAAFSQGLLRIDTAPQYGAGYAPQLVASAAGPACRISTKFGSPGEPAWRFAAKRLLGARRWQDLASWPTLHEERDRMRIEWWDAPVQRAWMGAVAAAVPARLQREFLFLHAPPMLLPQPVLARLAGHAHSLGFRLGLCGPRVDDLEGWLVAAPQFIDCVQLHLDTAIECREKLAGLPATTEVWVHGVYSPQPGATCALPADREQWCIDFGRDRSQFAVVAGCKRAEGVARLADFASRLQ